MPGGVCELNPFLLKAEAATDSGYLGDRANRDRNRECLVALSERDEIWKRIPRELAASWRVRDTAEADENGVSRRVIRIGDSADEVQLAPPEALPSDRRRRYEGGVFGPSGGQPWLNGRAKNDIRSPSFHRRRLRQFTIKGAICGD